MSHHSKQTQEFDFKKGSQVHKMQPPFDFFFQLVQLTATQQEKFKCHACANFFLELLASWTMFQKNNLTHCLNCALRNAWHLNLIWILKLLKTTLLKVSWAWSHATSLNCYCKHGKMVAQRFPFLALQLQNACLSLLGKTPRLLGKLLGNCIERCMRQHA
jgi:hypothetical protein